MLSSLKLEDLIVETLNDNFLLVTDMNQRSLLQVDLKDGSVRSLNRNNPSAVAYNPKTEIIYFINEVTTGDNGHGAQILSMSLINGKLTEYQYNVTGKLKSLSSMLKYIKQRFKMLCQLM